jgi:hypothetical protein
MTSTGLTRLHSFLENFTPETGNTSRKVLFANGWARSAGGTWYELTGATLSADATAKKESRLDYRGGVEGKSFFLRNCGFFNERSPTGARLTREGTGTAPDIDLAGLP